MEGGFEDENENEQTITINEYLNKVEEEELEADLVLGGDEGKDCTYNSGYMKRQAIFSCLTCTPDGNAGVCTACSLSCHDGHEIIELWTKRNFRCDCGNSKFGEFFCKLFPNKEVENANNSYNHNFKGLYCTCGRPYPDPDVQDQEEMIQCIVCEDWFHEKHIGLESSEEIPADDDGEPLYEDFICKTCSANFSFLTLYPQNVCASRKKSVDVTENSNSSKDKNVLVDVISVTGFEKVENHEDESSMSNPIIGSLSVANGSVTGESSTKNVSLDQSMEDASIQTSCVLGVDVLSNLPVVESKPLFPSKNWRDVLCRCKNCLDMYNQKKISYLLDKEDSIAEYEKIAKQKREENLQKQEGAEMNFFNNLGHVEKIEILNGIADFKEEFRTFMESFDTSKTVTSSDVHQIFENLAKKRRRE